MSTVLCDIDGVVGDFLQAVLDTAYDFTGVPRWSTDVTSWTIWHHLGANKTELKAIKREISLPGWCAAIPMFPGAVDFIAALKEQHEVVFVTSPWNSPTWVFEREEWIRSHFGSDSKTVHTAYKYMVKGDVLIDDKPKNVREWGRQWALGMPLLFDRPSNRADGEGLIRVNNYREVLSALDDFNSEILK